MHESAGHLLRKRDVERRDRARTADRFRPFEVDPIRFECALHWKRLVALGVVAVGEQGVGNPGYDELLIGDAEPEHHRRADQYRADDPPRRHAG